MAPEPITREDMYYDYLINGGDIQLIRSQTYDRTQKCLTGEPIYYNSDEGR